jgi:hypothetical protein
LAVGNSLTVRHCGQKATVGNNLGIEHIVAIEKHPNARYRLLVLEVASTDRAAGCRGDGGAARSV